jgi:hypothetical protein
MNQPRILKAWFEPLLHKEDHYDLYFKKYNDQFQLFHLILTVLRHPKLYKRHNFLL